MYNDTQSDTLLKTPDPSTDLAKAAKVYDPEKFWKATAQPISKLKLEEYHDLAKQAEPALQREMMAYCQERGLKYVVVPHEEFRKGYEQSRSKFRPWFNDFCERTGQNPHANVMIMTRVKELASAERKTRDNPECADRQKDYLAGMFLHLNENLTPRGKKDSIAKFTRALSDIENDTRTIARNNLFHKPLQHGFRGHKSAWEIEVPAGQELAGMPLVVSVKTEHEVMMPMDKLTRHFMHVTRETLASQASWWERCVDKALNTTRDVFHAAQHVKRMDRRPESLHGLSRRLYDYVFAQEGFNELLSESAAKAHAPLSLNALRVFVKTANDTFKGSDLEQAILDTGVLPPEKGARGLRMIRGGNPSTLQKDTI